MPTRRSFMHSLGGSVLLPVLGSVGANKIENPFPISCNTYNWTTFFRREGKTWMADPDQSLIEFSTSGLVSIEPAFTKAEEVQFMVPFLKKYRLQIPSAYVNSVLHDESQAAASIAQAMEIARTLKPLGTRILVTNPSPIAWGKKEAKSDAQIRFQVKQLEHLGKTLREMDMQLAYHIHDVELLAGAREFHHMLQNSHPENVSFCLDTHWIYRGCENSEVAVFDVLKMYRERVSELHLRQSLNGIWTESFTGLGDINYEKLAQILKEYRMNPHLVIEQAVEKGTPETMNGVESHRKSLEEVKRVFS